MGCQSIDGGNGHQARKKRLLPASGWVSLNAEETLETRQPRLNDESDPGDEDE